MYVSVVPTMHVNDQHFTFVYTIISLNGKSKHIPLVTYDYCMLIK